MQKISIPLDSMYKDTFVLVETISGTYICPGWHSVPQGTTREQIEFDTTSILTEKKDTTEVPKTRDITVEVLSSRGDKTYTVSYRAGIWDCTCPAKSFRRGDCKHIKAQKSCQKVF